MCVHVLKLSAVETGGELPKFSEHTCSRCMYMYVCLEYIHIYMYNKYGSEIELSRLEF